MVRARKKQVQTRRAKAAVPERGKCGKTAKRTTSATKSARGSQRKRSKTSTTAAKSQRKRQKKEKKEKTKKKREQQKQKVDDTSATSAATTQPPAPVLKSSMLTMMFQDSSMQSHLIKKSENSDEGVMFYTTKKGNESVGAIAKKFGMSASELVKSNKKLWPSIGCRSKLHIGTKIIIPAEHSKAAKPKPQPVVAARPVLSSLSLFVEENVEANETPEMPVNRRLMF